MTWHHNNRVYGSLADHTTIAAASVSGGFTCVYPSLLQKYYDQFLCFPFPQELFDDKYLDPQQQYMLMTLLRIKHRAVDACGMSTQFCKMSSAILVNVLYLLK